MLFQATPRLYPVRTVDLADWLACIPDPGTRFERMGVMHGNMPADWLTPPRSAARAFQTHYSFYAEQAELEFSTAAGTGTVAPGTFVLFPPDVPYEIRLCGRTSRTPLYRFRFRLIVEETLLTPWDAVQCFPQARQVPSHLDALQAELRVPSRYLELRVRAQLVLLFTELLGAREDEAAPSMRLTRAQQLALAEHIQRHVCARPTPGDLAARLRLSPVYFARVFKRTFGMPPRRWILEERIRHAAQRLLDSRQNVSEIARELGYENIYLFSRQFKAVLGLSPRAYRLRH